MQTGKWRLAAILAGAALAAGAAWLYVKGEAPPRPYRSPRNDRKRTVEVPVESMDDVVWGGRR